MPNRLQIARNGKVAAANFLVYLLLVGQCFAAPDFPGVAHGTYFAMYVADDFVALAIDSRRTMDLPDGRRVFADDQCKVLKLGTGAAFIAEGIISNKDQRAPSFDGFATARLAFQQSNGSLKRTADRWAADLEPKITALYPFYSNLLDQRHDGEIVVGYFLGIESNQVTAFKSVVLHNRATGTFSATTVALPKNNYTLLGPLNLVMELFEHQTPRAKSAFDQMQAEAAGKTGSESIDITLKYLVLNVPRWANDPGSGGDVAQAIIDRNNWRWMHRPDFCPEN
jgi:hypothetical protein